MKSSQYVLAAAMSAFAATAIHAAVLPVTWNAAEQPVSLGDGALSFTYDGAGAVAAMTVSAGAEVTMSGDGIVFADGAEIRMSGPGRMAFENAIGGTGALRLSNVDPARSLTYDGALLATNGWTKMFEGVQLSDYEPVKSIRRAESGVHDPGVYFPYNVRRTTEGGFETMSVQLMQYQPTTTKAILMRLRQNGADVEGIVDRVCYYSGRMILGEDVEKLLARHAVSPEENFHDDYYVHTPSFSKGYGVNCLVMRKRAAAEIVFDGACANGCTFKTGEGVSARAGETCLAADNTASIANEGGAFAFGGRSSGTGYASSISGNGTVELAEVGEAAGTPCTDAYAGYIAKSQVQISQNRNLATLTNVTADISGSYTSWTKLPATWCAYRGNGVVATGELQVAENATTLRFCVYELVQNSHNVRITGLKSGYVRTYKNATTGILDAQDYVGRISVYDLPQELKDDIVKTPSRYAELSMPSTEGSGQLGACNFRFFYSKPGARFLNANFANTMAVGADAPERINENQAGLEGLKLVIGGTDTKRLLVRSSSDYFFPTNGVVEIRKGGEFRSDKQGSNGARTVSGDSAIVRVEKGGLYRACASYTVGSYQHVVLDGGELAVRDDQALSSADAGLYLNHLTFRDGARVYGLPPRFGYAGNGSWRVAGTAPSTFDTGLKLYGGDNNASWGVEINVLDVTDDPAPDFFLNGAVDAFNNSHSNVVLRKTGGGTLAHRGTFGATLAAAPVSIETGVWLMDGVASPAQDYVLAGGSLSAAGVACTAGRLTVSAPCELKVAPGTALAFADSSAIAWMAEGRMEVDADLRAGAVRFGTTSTALTSEQLRHLRHGKFRVLLDENGYLRDDMSGLTIILR